ncbi:MAG: HlyD family secretion protein, partial [Candidatus Eremiobacteraeota bacterium]|nr:HlyD family secretion protein [Candidatus Eremiobacteraeota bacterium]
MDVVRVRGRKLPATPFAIVGALGLAAIGAYGAVALVHPRAVVPAVERAAVVTDVVRRGTLVRSISAAGAFVPGRIAVVAAPSDGLVAGVLVRAGTRVTAGTAIARLRNPDLEAELADLDAQIAAATAQQRAINEEGRAAAL